jgi:hypothetical protein
MMRRFFVFLVTIVMAGSIGAASAQGVPEQPIGSNPVGEPVVIYNSLGEEAAQITVIEVIDPFEDWAEYYDPQVGERYVVVSVQVENTGDRPFEFGTFDFSILDSVGRLHNYGFFVRSDASTVQLPDLEDASMLPGETVTGALNYTVPADAELVQVIYLYYADQQHLYLLADLRSITAATAGT